MCLEFGIEDCSCYAAWLEIVGTEDKSKSKIKTTRISFCDACVGSVCKSNCDGKCNGRHASFLEASASMVENLRTVFAWHNFITQFSRRVRVHEIIDEEQMFVGTAVEMKDDENVDDRCLKDDVSVGSVASRHAHDKGNGDGIGSFWRARASRSKDRHVGIGGMQRSRC